MDEYYDDFGPAHVSTITTRRRPGNFGFAMKKKAKPKKKTVKRPMKGKKGC